jgi:hypothetical protein
MINMKERQAGCWTCIYNSFKVTYRAVSKNLRPMSEMQIGASKLRYRHCLVRMFPNYFQKLEFFKHKVDHRYTKLYTN